MKKNTHKLPVFKNLQEIEEFWSCHEFTEFRQDFKEVKDVEVDIKNRRYLPVTLAMYEKLEKIASEQKTTVDGLIRDWVQEKLAEFQK